MIRDQDTRVRGGGALAVALATAVTLSTAAGALAGDREVEPIQPPVDGAPSTPAVDVEPNVPPRSSLTPPDLQDQVRNHVDWSYVAGRRADGAPSSEVTDGGECFRDVAFEDALHGFAVGFRLANPGEGSCEDADFHDQVPLLYEFDRGTWREVELPKGLTGPGGGYLAAVATYTRHVREAGEPGDSFVEAFAVGGTSSDADLMARYPRTEGSYTIDGDDADPAGDRAIVLHLGDHDGDGAAEWRALPPCASQGGARCIPDGMGPLTAVAVAETKPETRDFVDDPIHSQTRAELRSCKGVPCADLGVKNAEAFAFFGGAVRDYPTSDPADPDEPVHRYRGQLWLWHCLDRETNCVRGPSGAQVYDSDHGRGEGIEAHAMSDPESPWNAVEHKDGEVLPNRAWQVPPTFRIRDIEFLRGRRDFAYAVTAGCCASKEENKPLERVGQVQFWNGLTPAGSDVLLPGHWFGSSYGGSPVNTYEPPPPPPPHPEPGEPPPDETEVPVPGFCMGSAAGCSAGTLNTLRTTCTTYVNVIRPTLFGPGAPFSPDSEPEPMRSWKTDRCVVAEPQTIPVPVGEPEPPDVSPPSVPQQVHVPSQMPTIFGLALSPGRLDEAVDPPHVNPGLNSSFPGGYAIAGADGDPSAPRAHLGTSSYSVRNSGFNRISGRRDPGTNGFTEYLNGPMFGLDDRVWDVSVRGTGREAEGWAVGGSTRNGQALVYRIQDRDWLPTQAVGNAFELAGLIEPGGPDPLAYPERFVASTAALHGIDMPAGSGQGWAVGDDGAIVRYDDPLAPADTGTVSSGSLNQRSELPDRGGYDRFRRDRAGEPQIPPPVPRDGPELPDGRRGFDVYPRPPQPDGTNERAYVSVAVSPDGNTGWAVGGAYSDPQHSQPVRAHLARFDGEVWESCSFEPGSPCEVFKDRAVVLREVAVVPGVEGFEAYAVGDGPSVSGVPNAGTRQGATEVYHLEDGRWTLIGSEDGADRAVPPLAKTEKREILNPVRLSNVIVLGPDDVWVVGQVSPNGARPSPVIYRKDRDGWTECTDDGTRLPQGAAGDTTPGGCSDVDTRDDLAKSLLPRTEAVNAGTDTIVGAAAVGDRVYVAGLRSVRTEGPTSGVAPTVTLPFVIWTDSQGDSYRGSDGEPRQRWHNDEAGGGFEPSHRFDDRPPQDGFIGGRADTLRFTMGVATDGKREGWLIDRNRFSSRNAIKGGGLGIRREGTTMLRFDGERWRPFTEPNRVDEFLTWPAATLAQGALVSTAIGGTAASGGTLLTMENAAPLLRFDGRSWEDIPSPFFNPSNFLRSGVEAISAQPNGDIWGVATEGFFRYARTPRPDPFVPEPLPIEIGFASESERNVYALSSTPGGAVWLAGHSDVLARRDPVAGWDTVRVKGWRPRGGAIPPVYDISVRPDEVGFAVGGGGRVAEVDARGVTFDGAASALTKKHLRAVDVAPDGSAFAAGDDGTVLYRPAGGPWRVVGGGAIQRGDSVRAISMPTAERAYFAVREGASGRGRLARASLSDGTWEFLREDGNVSSDRAIHDLAVRKDGTGIAVGSDGVILERDSKRSERRPWRLRSERPVGDRNLHSVELSPSGPGVVIGSAFGDVLTLVDGGFQLARAGDPYNQNNMRMRRLKARAPMRAIAMLPGGETGQLEVLAAQGPELYRYTSAPEDSLIGRARLEPRPDTPPFGPGTLPLATFGRTVCHSGQGVAPRCPHWTGLPISAQLIPRRIVESIRRRAARGNPPALALFTGDVSDHAGDHTGFWSFRQAVIDPLQRVGVPAFAALGRWDLIVEGLASPPVLPPSPTRAVTENDDSSETWSGAFTDQAWPWGSRTGGRRIVAGESDASPPNRFSVTETGGPERVSAVHCKDGSSTQLDIKLGTPGKGIETERTDACLGANVPEVGNNGVTVGGQVKLRTVPITDEGARTHYAFKLVDSEDQEVLRIAVLDTAQGTVAYAPEDRPVEPLGQLDWLDRAICVEGTPQDGARECTRTPGVPAVVLSNRPTYSVSPGGQGKVLAEAAVLEQRLLDHDASLLIAGASGVNEKYWVTQASGLHEPRPDSEYPAPDEVPEVARLPVVQSSAAGGRRSEPDPSKGGWDGYSIAHIGPEGDKGLAGTLLGGIPPPPHQVPVPRDLAEPSEKLRRCANAGEEAVDREGKLRECHGAVVQKDVYVENRPVIDHVFMTASSHVLRAGQAMTVRGKAVGPVSYDESPNYMPLESGAITHRYDLIQADPDNPSQPLLDERGNYKDFPAEIAQIDRITGKITTNKRGPSERHWALALLSVGDKAATYPIAFDPRRSFVPRPGSVVAPQVTGAQQAASVSPTVPSIKPHTPASFTFPKIDLPKLSLPNLPNPQAPSAKPAPPPPPPPPPVAPVAQALQLSTAPVGLNVGTPPTVVPPPAPPVNPAPPGGARREARQRQAATEKSGAGHDDQDQPEQKTGTEANRVRIDAAQSPPSLPGAPFTRRDRFKPGESFTPVVHREQPSAWARGVLYGGGLTLTALVLALGWSSIRPGPRRKPPTVPEPAWARYSRRRY